MYCPNCGTKLTKEAAFCHKCGNKIPAELINSEPNNVADRLPEEDYDTLFSYSTEVTEADYDSIIPEKGEEKKPKLFGIGKLIENERTKETIKSDLNFDIPDDWDDEPVILKPAFKKSEEPSYSGNDTGFDIPDNWDSITKPKGTKDISDTEYSEGDINFDIPSKGGTANSSGASNFDIPDDWESLDEGKTRSDFTGGEYSEDDLDFSVPDDL